jgi:hemerythrin-like domain-containing protein
MLVDRGSFHALLFDILIEEHRLIATLVERALALPSSEPAERVAAFARISRLVRAHAGAEEDILFPVLDGSYELGHHVREDVAVHAAIAERMRRIERTPADGVDWSHDLAALWELLAQHFADEENVVFPRARCVISDGSSMELAISYERDRDRMLELLGEGPWLSR